MSRTGWYKYVKDYQKSTTKINGELLVIIPYAHITNFSYIGQLIWIELRHGKENDV
jgi:hypothetical protein